MLVTVKHEALLQQLGLATLEGVRSFTGDLVKNHRGRRDIFRIPAGAGKSGQPLTLFLKRNWKPYKKDGLMSLIRRGRVWSVSRQEWENSLALAQAGIPIAGLVSYGEECGLFWEKFSFIVTEAATGTRTVEDFLKTCRESARRRQIFDALARTIRQMHDAGLATPDLFTRHVFVDESQEPPRFCLIDMARLDRRRCLSMALRARDLAALNITAPLRHVSPRERMRFLRIYAGSVDRLLFEAIRRRMQHLSTRRKFAGFAQGR